MTQTKKHFFSSHKTAKFFATFVLSLIILPFVADAAPAARTTVSRTAPNAGNRTPITKTNTNVKATNKQSATVTKTTTAAPEKTKPNITNKTSQFDDVISADDESVITDSALAAEIRRQRESMDNQTQIQDANATLKTYISGGKNECDTKLRSCMSQKCGNDFTKCSGDTDTLWGTKMESCRRDLPCTGEEYKLFAIEIKADRDANTELSLYNSIISCGKEYDACITTQCGTNYSKCLGKKSGDAAIEKCKSIAKRCTEQDSGLASRTMSVFGNLRSFAEETVARDEARLYELRDLMRQTCERLGAKFDDRTLDCVYTVQFHAGEDNAVQASRKAYAGTTFACTPDWFGVDVTTYMENAFRLTREQTSASSAIMGAGVGLGVGAITSGAIGRSIDTAKAERELNQKLCEDDFGTWNKTTHTCKCPSGQKFVKESGCEDKKTTTRGTQNSTTSTGSQGGGQSPVEPTNTDPDRTGTEGVNKTFTTPTTEEIVEQTSTQSALDQAMQSTTQKLTLTAPLSINKTDLYTGSSVIRHNIPKKLDIPTNITSTQK